MKRLIVAALLSTPALAFSAPSYLDIDHVAGLVDGSIMKVNPEIELLSTGVARYANPAYDEEVEDSPKWIEGEWFVKEPVLTEDEEQADNAQEIYDERKTDLRSVFCETWDRTLCWDIEQLSFNQLDADCEEDCDLDPTQEYKMYREGRTATREVLITRR